MGSSYFVWGKLQSELEHQDDVVLWKATEMMGNQGFYRSHNFIVLRF